MKANELRLGNIIKGGAITLLEVSLSYATEHEEPQFDCIQINGHTISEPQPETLTEEWLLRLGLDKGEERGFFPGKFIKKYTHILIESKIELEFIDENLLMWLEGNTNVHMRYVHQLQNLYFALTGEELTIK